MSEETKFGSGGVLQWFGAEFFKRVEDDYIKKMLLRATVEYERIVQDLIRLPKHGRTYKVPGTSVYYTASKKGEAPAVRTGRLRQSIRHVISKTGPMTWQAVIGPTVKVYPAVLEDPRGLDRPLWGVALRQLSRKMDGILRIDRLK